MIEYKVDIENKTVQAKLSKCEYDAINRIENMFNSRPFSASCDSIGYSKSKRYMMADTYTGTVKVRGDDIFSEEKGKILAKEKLIRNYRKGFNKRIDAFVVDFLTFSTELKHKRNLYLKPIDKHNPT